MKKITLTLIFFIFSASLYASCVSIKDFDIKIISGNKKITIYAYKINFDNTCNRDLTIRGEVRAIDDEGYKLYSSSYNVEIPEFGEAEYSDTMTILNDVANQIDKFIAGGSVYK